jgi:hypothetical protein
LAVALNTGHPARNDNYSQGADAYGDAIRRLGLRSRVAAPIVVEGRLWGAIAVGTRHGLFTPDTEQRMAGFTELIGTAIANADNRAQLTASRARIVAAADEARRRIERDLHDGSQQRLVSLGLALRAAQASVPAQLPDARAQIGWVADELTGVTEELREIARGIHPAILSEGGLRPALRTLARRAAIPVELDIRTRTRPAEPIEVAAYYVVSEALTNTTKHASASHAHVAVEEHDARLHLSIRDDGVGGRGRPCRRLGPDGAARPGAGPRRIHRGQQPPRGRHRDPRRASVAARLTGRPALLPRDEWRAQESATVECSQPQGVTSVTSTGWPAQPYVGEQESKIVRRMQAKRMAAAAATATACAYATLPAGGPGPRSPCLLESYQFSRCLGTGPSARRISRSDGRHGLGPQQ